MLKKRRRMHDDSQPSITQYPMETSGTSRPDVQWNPKTHSNPFVRYVPIQSNPVDLLVQPIPVIPAIQIQSQSTIVPLLTQSATVPLLTQNLADSQSFEQFKVRPPTQSVEHKFAELLKQNTEAPVRQTASEQPDLQSSTDCQLPASERDATQHGQFQQNPVVWSDGQLFVTLSDQVDQQAADLQHQDLQNPADQPLEETTTVWQCPVDFPSPEDPPLQDTLAVQPCPDDFQNAVDQSLQVQQILVQSCPIQQKQQDSSVQPLQEQIPSVQQSPVDQTYDPDMLKRSLSVQGDAADDMEVESSSQTPRLVSKAEAPSTMIVIEEEDVVDLWHLIGERKQFKTDIEIARFLLQLYFSPRQEKLQPTDQCVHCGTVLSRCCVTCLLASQRTPSSRPPPPPPGPVTQCHTSLKNGSTPQKNCSISPRSSGVSVRHTDSQPVLDHSEEEMEADDFLDTCQNNEEKLRETASKKTAPKRRTLRKTTPKKTDCSCIKADIEVIQANQTFSIIKTGVVKLTRCDIQSDFGSSEQMTRGQSRLPVESASVHPKTKRRQNSSSSTHGGSLTAGSDVTPDIWNCLRDDDDSDAGSPLLCENGSDVTAPLPEEKDAVSASPLLQENDSDPVSSLPLENNSDPGSPLPQENNPDNVKSQSYEGEPVPDLPVNIQSPECCSGLEKTSTVTPKSEPVAHSSSPSAPEGFTAETDSGVVLPSLVTESRNSHMPAKVGQRVYATRSRGPLPPDKKDMGKETFPKKQMISMSNARSNRCSSNALPKKRMIRRPVKSPRYNTDEYVEIQPSKKRKSRKGGRDEEWAPSDSELDKLSQNIDDSDEEIKDSELFKPYKKKHFRTEKEYTIEEFMAGKIQIPIGALHGKQFNKHGQFSYYSHYTCPKCSKVFVSKPDYRQHLSAHRSKQADDQPAPQGPDPESLKILTEIKERLLFCCPHCNRVFMNGLQLKKHVLSHSYSVDSEGVYTCHLCKGTFQTLECVSRHFKTPKGRMETCEACGFRYTYQCQMKGHREDHCLMKDAVKACEVCGQSFGGLLKREIKKHLKTHNIGDACEFCGQSLDGVSKRDIKKHMKTHEEVKRTVLCTICGKVLSHSSFHHHRLTHTDKTPFSCSVCQKVFKYKSSLEKHKLTHEEKLLQCDHCEAKFRRSHQLQHHKNFRHQGKCFQCQECGRNMSSKGHLRKHLHNVHKLVRKYACKFCGMAFGYQQKLDRHERIHTGEKPFQCEYCPAKFVQKYYLNVHTRMHTGEKRYYCEDCGQSFAFRSSYTSHRKSRHSDKHYSCVQCKKQFLDKSDLAFHCRTWHDMATLIDDNTQAQS